DGGYCFLFSAHFDRIQCSETVGWKPRFDRGDWRCDHVPIDSRSSRGRITYFISRTTGFYLCGLYLFHFPHDFSGLVSENFGRSSEKMAAFLYPVDIYTNYCDEYCRGRYFPLYRTGNYVDFSWLS